MVISFSLGCGFGYFYFKNKELPQPLLVHAKTENYKFINPLLFLQVPEDESTPQFQSIKKDVKKYVDDVLNKDNAIDVSVYFRDLNSTRWVGVNPDDKYSPASMMKVVSLLAYLRAEEENPSLADKKVFLNPSGQNEDSVEDYFPTKHKVKIGSIYSTEELLNSMIINSDNNALYAIDSLTGDKILNDTYLDFRIPIDDAKSDPDFLSVKMYSRIFRSLYNGTYISQILSNKALDLLSKTNFTLGLVAGVPHTIVVSHKFGERTIKMDNTNSSLYNNVKNIRELHDCGIVHAPNNPYFICVMTKGYDFQTLQKIISDISSLVWKQSQSFKN